MMSFFSQIYLKHIFSNDFQDLWEIVGTVFDVWSWKILWCVVKRNFLKYGYFLFSDLKSVLDNEKIFVWEVYEYNENIYDLYLKQVRDNFWVIGNIIDIEIEEGTWKLKNIIVDAGYNLSSIELVSPTKISIKKNIIELSKNAIISFEKDFLFIESNNVLKENKKTLENISKIFINIPKHSYNINLK